MQSKHSALPLAQAPNNRPVALLCCAGAMGARTACRASALCCSCLIRASWAAATVGTAALNLVCSAVGELAGTHRISRGHATLSAKRPSYSAVCRLGLDYRPREEGPPPPLYGPRCIGVAYLTGKGGEGRGT